MSIEVQLAEVAKALTDLNINLAAFLNAQNKAAAQAAQADAATGGDNPKKNRGSKPASAPADVSSPITAETPPSAAPAASAANSVKAAPQSPATPPPAATSTSQPSPANSSATEAQAGAITVATVAAAFKKVAQTKGREAVVAALAAVGATTLGDVTPDQYPALLSELDTALLM